MHWTCFKTLRKIVRSILFTTFILFLQIVQNSNRKWFEMFDRSSEWGHWTGEILKAQMGFWNQSRKLIESNTGEETQKNEYKLQDLDNIQFAWVSVWNVFLTERHSTWYFLISSICSIIFGMIFNDSKLSVGLSCYTSLPPQHLLWLTLTNVGK